jgi:solute carrier family 8 (sodium/calcium exchanger)
VLGSPNVATIIILDDDFCGIFNFAEKDVDTSETAGVIRLKVSRWSGARGKVAIKYRTVNGTAVPGRDFMPVDGVITFQDSETE